MLLAVDVGNTNTVFALFEGAVLRASWRSVTESRRTADDYAVFLLTHLQKFGGSTGQIEDVMIGSVVPDTNFHLEKFCRDYLKREPLMVGAPNVETGLTIKMDAPGELGADRIVNAVGGLLTHKPPLLILDFGTATTFDVVDASGAYIGGAIAPGINLSLQALHMAAAKLPRIGIAPTRRVIATNTTDAIRSGVYWGYAGLIEGMIARIQAEVGQPLTVLATGGLAPLFADIVKAIHSVDDTVTLRGLAEIYARTKRRTAGA